MLNPNPKLNFPPKLLNLASLASLTCVINVMLFSPTFGDLLSS